APNRTTMNSSPAPKYARPDAGPESRAGSGTACCRPPGQCCAGARLRSSRCNGRGPGPRRLPRPGIQNRVFSKSCGSFLGFLDCREHAGKDLKGQVLLIAQAIGTALKDADFVVETLDEAEGDFVLGPAIGGDAVPVTLDHRRELLVGLEPLPFK